MLLSWDRKNSWKARSVYYQMFNMYTGNSEQEDV